MTNERRLLVPLLLTAALASACKSTDDEPTPTNTTTIPDAGASTGGPGGTSPAGDGAAGSAAGGAGDTGGSGVSATGGSTGTGGSATGGSTGTGGSGGSAAAVRSNIPGLVFEYSGTDPTGRGIQILSSNLTQEAIGSDVFQEWLAEVKNGSAKTVCLMRIKASFFAGSAILADVDAFADGPPYKMDISKVTTSCLAPGETGVFWDLDEVPRLTSISTATKATYTLELLGDDLLRPHPDTPTVTPTGVFDRFGTGSGWSLKGTVTAKATIYNNGLDIYPIDDRGLVIASLSAVHLETLFAGSSWDFQSSTVKTRFSKQHVFPEWIDGAKTAAVPREPILPLAGDDLRGQFRARRNALKERRDFLRLAP